MMQSEGLIVPRERLSPPVTLDFTTSALYKVVNPCHLHQLAREGCNTHQHNLISPSLLSFASAPPCQEQPPSSHDRVRLADIIR